MSIWVRSFQRWCISLISTLTPAHAASRRPPALHCLGGAWGIPLELLELPLSLLSVAHQQPTAALR